MDWIMDAVLIDFIYILFLLILILLIACVIGTIIYAIIEAMIRKRFVDCISEEEEEKRWHDWMMKL